MYAKTGEAVEKSYADTVLLQPGETEEVTIRFNTADFRSYDMNYPHDDSTGAYMLEAGEYWFATGNGAHDAVQAVLKAAYPDAAKDMEPTGDTHAESVATDTYFTDANGVIIHNQLSNADLNQYDTGTELISLSRYDWANTFPESLEDLTATDEMMNLRLPLHRSWDLPGIFARPERQKMKNGRNICM